MRWAEGPYGQRTTTGGSFADPSVQWTSSQRCGTMAP